MNGRTDHSGREGAEDGHLAQVVLLNRQRGVRFEKGWLEKVARCALERCVGVSADGEYALRALEEVVVTVVSDRRIAKIHGDFMGIPTATDVITFQHGEIVVSADTAQRCGTQWGHGLEKELALYVVHGFLHLNGFTDLTEPERAHMHAVQDKIWNQCLTDCPLEGWS